MLNLGTNTVFGIFTGSIVLDVFDEFSGNVAAGDTFNTKSRGGIYLKNKWPTTGAHQVNTGDMESHRFSGLNGDALFFGG